MLSNILPVIAFAGAVMAACPLAVEITSTKSHIAQVAITNIGNTTVTFFKGNTVLSPHATLDLLATDATGNDLTFEGVYVNYKKSGLVAENFQTLAPGQSVTAAVNAAKSYKLAGIAKAKISAIQGFKYVVGAVAPSSTIGIEFCESVSSGTVAITPDQSKVALEHISTRAESSSGFNSRIKKRAVTYSSCTTAQTTSLKTSVTHAISMSSAAYTAANTALYSYTVWFISTAYKTTVRAIYNDVVGVQTTSPTISCTDTYSDCTDGTALLYTVPSANYIVPCPNNGFWGFPEYATTCADDDYDRAGSILHEITHLYGTDDWAYGSTAARKLSAAHAAANADTYEMYAGSVRLGGCTS